MTLQKLLIVSGALCAFVLLACSQPPTLTDEVAPSMVKPAIAANNGMTIQLKQLFRALNNSINVPPGGYVPDSLARFYLDSMLADTLTGFEADSLALEKYDRDYYEFRDRWASAQAVAYYKVAVEREVHVDSAQVLAFYEKYKDQMTMQDAVEIYHIFVAPTYYRHGPDSAKYSGMTDKEVDTVAYRFSDSLYQILQSGADFKKIAEQYSHDAQTKSLGGYVGWTNRHTYRDPFDSVVFRLKAGEYCRPYHDPDGYHIVYVVHKVDSGPLPINQPDAYAQVRDKVVKETTQNRLGKVLDSLLRGFKCQFNPAIVDSMILQAPDNTWYAIVNGDDTLDITNARGLVDGYMSKRKLRVMTDDQRKTAIEALIRRALFVEGAQASGLDTTVELRRQKKLLWHIGAKRQLMDQWYGPEGWKPSDSDAVRYYHSHLEQFAPARPFKVQQIVFKDSLTAEFVRDQANAGEDFMELAKKYYASADSSVREPLADLGEIGPSDVDSNFFRMAQGTPPGDVSAPVKTKFGYHIIKMISRRDPKTVSDAIPEIKVILTGQHRNAEFSKFREKLFKKYQVKYPNEYGRIFLKPIANRTKL